MLYFTCLLHSSYLIGCFFIRTQTFIVHVLCVEQEGSPFIVCMTYAFQTPEKLCFILDLMNGGDLHYHLSQHGVFTEKEVRFYAAEVMLGLEHMHSRFVVYRDLKVGFTGRPFLLFFFIFKETFLFTFTTI